MRLSPVARIHLPVVPCARWCNHPSLVQPPPSPQSPRPPSPPVHTSPPVAPIISSCAPAPPAPSPLSSTSSSAPPVPPTTPTLGLRASPPAPSAPAMPACAPPAYASSPSSSTSASTSAAASSSPPALPRTLPRTISAALRARGRHNTPQAYAEYAPYLTVTRRFLGEAPSFYPVLSLSPAAMRTHVGLFARMFHVPQVDLRLPGFLTPELRRLAFLAASDGFRCDYCKVHAFSFGDMLRGSVPEQVRRGKGGQVQVGLEGGGGLGSAGKAIVRYARAAVRRPFVVGKEGWPLEELAREVEGEVGVRGLEVVKAVVAFSGALNSVMDVQGVTLEPEVQAFAVRHLPVEEGEFVVNKHHRNEVDEEAMTPWRGEDPSLMGMRGKAENMRVLLGVMPAAVTGMKYDMFELYDGIPMRTGKLFRWLEDRLGRENCAWFRAIQGTELKRAFCFGLRENILVEDARPRCWTLSARVCFLYLFARVTESVPLAEMAVALMPSAGGATDAEQRRQLSRFVRCPSRDLLRTVAVARRLVHAAAVKMANISPKLVEDCTETCSGEALMEVASLISFFEMWRRMVLLFTPKSKIKALPVGAAFT